MHLLFRRFEEWHNCWCWSLSLNWLIPNSPGCFDRTRWKVLHEEKSFWYLGIWKVSRVRKHETKSIVSRLISAEFPEDCDCSRAMFEKCLPDECTVKYALFSWLAILLYNRSANVRLIYYYRDTDKSLISREKSKATAWIVTTIAYGATFTTLT